MSYYNTTSLSGEELQQAVIQAEKQEDAVLFLFRMNERLTPSEAWIKYNQITNNNTPLTSIRRAITNLEHNTRLVKLEDQKIGLYGRKEGVWKLF